MRGWTALAAAALLLGAAGCAKKVTQVATEPAPRPVIQGNVIEHRVQPGESIADIADNYYGDPGRAERIVADNGLASGAVLTPGSILRLRFDQPEWDSARRRAAALAPYHRGVELLAADRLGEAQAQFEGALAECPDLLAARYNLALVLLKRGKAEEALGHLDILAEARPGAADFAFARGNALFQTARFAEAADQFAAIIALDAQDKRATFGLARSLQEEGRRAEAIAAWEGYLRLDPDSSWAASARRNLESLRRGD